MILKDLREERGIEETVQVEESRMEIWEYTSTTGESLFSCSFFLSIDINRHSVVLSSVIINSNLDPMSEERMSPWDFRTPKLNRKRLGSEAASAASGFEVRVDVSLESKFIETQLRSLLTQKI